MQVLFLLKMRSVCAASVLVHTFLSGFECMMHQELCDLALKPNLMLNKPSLYSQWDIGSCTKHFLFWQGEAAHGCSELFRVLVAIQSHRLSLSRKLLKLRETEKMLLALAMSLVTLVFFCTLFAQLGVHQSSMWGPPASLNDSEHKFLQLLLAVLATKASQQRC